MTRRRLEKLTRMDLNEIAWRGRAAARVAFDRARATAMPPQWERRDFVRVLSVDQGLGRVADLARAGKWLETHAALSQAIATGPQRFVIGPRVRPEVSARTKAEFPSAAHDAAARAEGILAGAYDLLGYRGLRFAAANPSASSSGTTPDWHYDPVHRRTAPVRFWSSVPFLSPALGDHKIVWELNRHQHWLALGRAYWLTGDDRFRARFVDELASWMAANPPLMGINWASMLELAFRSISWLWAVNFFVDEGSSDDSPWLVDLTLALDRQLTQISRNLSRYFSPNTHLIGEALALYVAGRSAWWLAGAARYEEIGRTQLLHEIPRQIASDGGHRERSTHYHRYTLDFYLLALAVSRITDDPATPLFEAAAAGLADAARLLADSRGSLPHIGDDDGGSTWPLTGRAVDDVRDSLAIAGILTGRPALQIGPLPEEACWLLAHPTLDSLRDFTRRPSDAPIASAALPETGYYVSRSTEADHLVIDAGPHGYQNSGHAHADALSLTFSVRGLPLIIDPGTGCYTVDPAVRDRFRSTALHNTLTFDGAPQSVGKGPFHWQTTANGTARRWRTNAGFDYFEGSHDGYRPFEHRRHVLALHGDLLVVADLITTPSDDFGLHRADAHWHLDPRWTTTASGRRWLLKTAGERVQLVAPHGVIEQFTADESGLGWHAPVYGRLEPATTLRLSHTSSAPFWMVTVFGLNAANEVLDVETLPAWAEAGLLAHSLALRIHRSLGSDYLLLADPADPSASTARSWRLAEFETDAAMLFCRLDAGCRLTRLAMVDGSRVRAGGGSRVTVAVPALVPHLHVDFSGEDARLSGPSTGARVSIGSQPVGVAIERRSTARCRAAGRNL